MADYRHDKRAGNFGDVHKHIALLAALSATAEAADATSNRKVLYIETHAASASYESTSSKAEEDTGVGRVLAADESKEIMSQEIQVHADTIKRYRSGGGKSENLLEGLYPYPQCGVVIFPSSIFRLADYLIKVVVKVDKDRL